MSMELTRAYTQSTKLFLDQNKAMVMEAAQYATSAFWNWNTQAPPPASGQVRTNSRDWATATQLQIHSLTGDGTDTTTSQATIKAGDSIRLEQATDYSRFAVYTVSGAPSSSGGVFSYPVTLSSSGGTLPNSGASIQVTLTPAVAPPGGVTTSEPFDSRGFGTCGIILPANFQGTSLSFLVSSTLNGQYRPLYAGTALVTIPANKNWACQLPSSVVGWPYWKLLSNAVETDVSVIIVAQA